MKQKAVAPKATATNQEVGRFGENVAAETLVEQGWQLLDRNWRGLRGELDLVGLDGATLVGIEVKTRSSLAFGAPAAAVTTQKIARLRRLLGQWTAEHRHSLPAFSELRIDVISVLLAGTTPSDGGQPLVEHLRGVS
jgi:putative endonuclease